jgi:predicted nucleic acid-binding protein
MKKNTAFWDASALVPLCVQEAATAAAVLHLRNLAPVIWWGSPVEIKSAICRLHREKAITDAGKKTSLLRLDALNGTWREVSAGDELRELALDVLDRYSLKAADSFQLAAALIWCERRPARRKFVCAHERLSRAANLAGFAALELRVGSSPT